MGIYKEDTKKLIARDTEEYRHKQKEIKDKVAKALEGYSDSMIHGVLTSTLHYGFKMSNGQWHPAPNQHSSTIITEGEEINVDD